MAAAVRRSRCGTHSRVIRISPSTFVTITSRSSSSCDSHTGSRPRARPALLTRMSRPPSSATRGVDEPLGSSRASVTSRFPSRREPPYDASRPPPASAAAVAAPIPLDAPVTIARLPSRASHDREPA